MTNSKCVFCRFSKDKKVKTWENDLFYAMFDSYPVSHPKINTKPDAYNHGLNDGKAAGRTVNHLHWHIIPRYKGDMNDPRGGVRHVIPNLGNYKIKREK